MLHECEASVLGSFPFNGRSIETTSCYLYNRTTFCVYLLCAMVGLVLETLCALFVVCLLAGLWIFVFKKIIADF